MASNVHTKSILRHEKTTMQQSNRARARTNDGRSTLTQQRRTRWRANRMASNSGDFNHFDCPVKVARPNAASDLPKSCSNKKTTMRSLKDHIKTKHKCNCEEGGCQSAAHLSIDQLNSIACTTLHRFDSIGQQWAAMLSVVCPDAQPPPSYQPTFRQIVELSRRPPAEFSESLQRQFDEKQAHETGWNPISVHQFFSLLHIYVDQVSETGAIPDAEPLPGPDSDSSPPSPARTSLSTPETRESVDFVMTPGSDGLDLEPVVSPPATSIARYNKTPEHQAIGGSVEHIQTFSPGVTNNWPQAQASDDDHGFYPTMSPTLDDAFWNKLELIPSSSTSDR